MKLLYAIVMCLAEILAESHDGMKYVILKLISQRIVAVLSF